jgi:hypothetical protein
MKQLILIFFVFWGFISSSCTSEDRREDSLVDTAQSRSSDGLENREIRPVILGNKKINPYSAVNMNAALDTLKAHPNELSQCLNSPMLVNQIEINSTDLYVRFLPKDSIQYKRLMTDTTLTLFDFPLDYEIEQTGEFYHDPTVPGVYTWLYTKVPKNYIFPEGITYEVIEELFIMENSPYYSEEKMNEDGLKKAPSVAGENMNDLLRTLEAVAFFNAGYKYGNLKSADNQPEGMQKIKLKVKKRFLWHTWYDYEYFPSGTIKVQSNHEMDRYGNTILYSSLTEVPLKGVKVHFWDGFFKWNSDYTDENGNYLSETYYNNDLYYDLYFMGRNGNNSWTMDRVMLWTVCLWVQKLSLGSGRESNDGYSTTIKTSSGGWDASVTNNAFYEYMTLTDREGLTRPPTDLKVALLESGGMCSTPLFQNHTNTYTTAILSGFIAYALASGGSGAPATVTYMAFLNSLPDITISGGRLYDDRITDFYEDIWHELAHASTFERIKEDVGYTKASALWSDFIVTEIGHSDNYGSKGDNNWQQIALYEGWAMYIEKKLPNDCLLKEFICPSNADYPMNYKIMFHRLDSIGCSIVNLERCLSAKTLASYKNKLTEMYPDLSASISKQMQPYE